MDCPGKEHWNAVCTILKYLKGTRDLRITYTSTESSKIPILYGYSDADWAANDLDTRHSHSGYVFYLSNGPIAWKSRLQASIALSSMDAEYYSMGDAAKEAIELRQVHHEVNKFLSKSDCENPTVIHADNASSIKLSENPVFHKRSKHIAIRHHFLRQFVEENIIKFEYIQSAENIADVLTKPLHKNLFRPMCSKLMGRFTVLL